MYSSHNNHSLFLKAEILLPSVSPRINNLPNKHLDPCMGLLQAHQDSFRPWPCETSGEPFPETGHAGGDRPLFEFSSNVNLHSVQR